MNKFLRLCYHCHQYPVPNPGEAYCLVCSEWLKERSEWKARVFKRDEIIKELEKLIKEVQAKFCQKCADDQKRGIKG